MPRQIKGSPVVNHASRIHYYIRYHRITSEEINMLGEDTDKIKAYANLIKSIKKLIDFGLEEMVPLAIERALEIDETGGNDSQSD